MPDFWFPDDREDPRIAVIFDDVLPRWEVWVFLDHEHGMPLVHEIRVAPPRTGKPYRRAAAGGLKAGDRSKINIGTLRLRAYRAVVAAMERLRETNPDWWERWARELAVFETFEATTHAVADRRFRDRRAITPLRLAQIAEGYVQAASTGPKPYEQMRETMGYSEDYLRDLVKEARRQGYLTRPSQPGRAGGKLTAKAQRILNKRQEDTDGID